MKTLKRIAVIRVRGRVDVPEDIESTLYLLRLRRTNYCVVIDNRDSYMGMLRKVKDWVTWGEIRPDVFKILLLKRGRLKGNKRLTEEYIKEKLGISIDEFVKEFFEFKRELKDIPNLKPFFRLHPPRKGYGRKGIKQHFKVGGALGYRGEKINDLILRMI